MSALVVAALVVVGLLVIALWSAYCWRLGVEEANRSWVGFITRARVELCSRGYDSGDVRGALMAAARNHGRKGEP